MSRKGAMLSRPIASPMYQSIAESQTWLALMVPSAARQPTPAIVAKIAAVSVTVKYLATSLR